ncbi:hypothetical protein ACF08N_37670 [Streptomyces sp. NPDC015127]|uniref:hypothetical protein n=1 Tax=Streptomyces sp. NPDC015127 TaxID=3364939 RepID=UPI0037015FE9
MKIFLKKLSIAMLATAAMAGAAPTGASAAELGPGTTSAAPWVDSPLSYEYDYSLGMSFFYDAEMVANGADTHFYDTFPFEEHCGSFGNLPPEHNPPFTCYLNVAGLMNPIAVTDRTPTSFTFKSLPGHVEGAGRYIRFTFHRTSTFDIRMHVESWGPWNFNAWSSINSGAVNGIWATYSNNLKNRITNGTL